MIPSLRSSITISFLSVALGSIYGYDCIVQSWKSSGTSNLLRQHSRTVIAFRRSFFPRDNFQPFLPVPNRIGSFVNNCYRIVSSLSDSVNSLNSDQSVLSMSDATLLPKRTSLRRTVLVSNENRNRKRDDVQVVGHRGAIYQCLENTIESFMYCADTCKCHAVELDVFVIKDGTVVVFHGCDSDPDIPGSLQGYCLPSDFVFAKDGCTYRSIIDLTYEETQQLQFNPQFEEFVCPEERIINAKIPRLHDVLLQLSNTSLQEIKIELKGPGTVQPVLSLVEQLHLEQFCSYSSFDHTLLKELRTLRPDKSLYRTGALFNAPICDDDDYLHRARMCGATAIHLRYDDCTIDRIQTIHDHDFVSMAWFRGPMGMVHDALYRFDDIGDIADVTNAESNNVSFIENEACYRTLLDTGVQQICCNRPDLLIKLIRSEI